MWKTLLNLYRPEKQPPLNNKKIYIDLFGSGHNLFEIHITISKKLSESEIPEFERFCKENEAKAILIELSKCDYRTQQPMLTKKIKGSTEWTVNDEIDRLFRKLIELDYGIKRIKVEIPLSIDYDKSYPFCYFEWHGKIMCSDHELLNEKLPSIKGAHLSKNNLKNQPNCRFLTIRNYDTAQDFAKEISSLKDELKEYVVVKRITFIKEEFEICIYDNKPILDDGWMTPLRDGQQIFNRALFFSDESKIFRHENFKTILYESFIKRAEKVGGPFALKGSFLTRQCIQNKTDRQARDLDYLYLGNEKEASEISEIFTRWMQQVFSYDVNDNVLFEFEDHHFWSGVDYAMDDDFPTTYSDFKASFCGHSRSLDIDISWNLPSNFNPAPIQYNPEVGDAFTLSKTIPVPVQIAWKLHQTVMRPRAKDLIDITLLIEKNKLKISDLDLLYSVFTQECAHGNIDINRLELFRNNNVSRILRELEKRDPSNHLENYEFMMKEIDFEIRGLTMNDIANTYTDVIENQDIYTVISKFIKALNSSGISKRVLG